MERKNASEQDSGTAIADEGERKGAGVRASGTRRRPEAAPGDGSPANGGDGPRQGRAPEAPYTSFEDVYRRQKNYVWRYIRRTLGDRLDDDAAEDIHGKVFCTMDTIVQKEMPDNVPAMLTTLARNEILNELRRRHDALEYDDRAEIEAEPAVAPSPEDTLAEAETRAELREQFESILDGMPRGAANRIRQLDLGDFEHQELADLEERPLETIRTQHKRARSRFFALARRFFKLGGGR
jgi:RNA polymerase sigma factor (sigma-70 family)